MKTLTLIVFVVVAAAASLGLDYHQHDISARIENGIAVLITVGMK
jgi:hypothetical protein